MKARWIIPVILFCLVKTVPAQTGTVILKGSVKDEKGLPLPYANVYLESTLEGAMSDAQGAFSFSTKASGPQALSCTYIGYEPQKRTFELRIGTTTTVDFVLKTGRVRGKTVTVTASAFTASDEEGVTLTALDVVRTPGSAADIFWAVKSFPGIQQVEEGAGLFVRGGDVSETAVYLDGALIQHPYKYESPTGGFFGTFSPFLLKGTYFSSGGFSAQYGHALSGVLAMESMDLPPQQQMGLGLGLAAGSAFVAMPVVPGKLGFQLSGNISNTETMFKLNNSRKHFSRYPEAWDVNFSTVWKPDPQSQLKLFIFHESDRVGIEVEDPDYTTHFHGDAENQLINLRWSRALGKGLLLSANLAQSRFTQIARMGVLDLNTRDRVDQARLQADYQPTSPIKLKFGLEAYRFFTRIQGRVPLDQEDVNPEAPSIQVDTDYQSDRITGFIEAEWLTLRGIQCIPGLRVTHESITARTHADPRVSVIVPLVDHINFTAALGQYRQHPAPRHFDPYVGNPDLTVMRADHLVAGIHYQREETILRIEAYYKKYGDILLEEETVNLTNNGYGNAHGIDCFIKHRMGRFSGWIAYSWLEARRKWNDLPVSASPYFDITHNLTTVVTVDLPGAISLGVSARYATGKPYTPAPESFHTARVPDYFKMDLSLSKILSLFSSNMTIVYLAVSNLTGRINVFDYKYSSDYERRTPVESSFGRSVYFGFQFNWSAN